MRLNTVLSPNFSWLYLFIFYLYFFQANHGGIRGKEIPQQFFSDEGREENGNEFDSDDDDVDYRQLVEHAKEVSDVICFDK